MENRSRLAAWLRPSPHDARRSIALVRVAVALIVATHPLYAMSHPTAMRELARDLSAHGLPYGLGIAWATMVVSAVCALGLLARRFVTVAALGTMAVLAVGIALFYAPFWYVAGGALEEGHPGAEFNVLLIGCLLGVVWASWPRRATPVGGGDDRALAEAQGLAIIRVVAAVLLMPHPLHAFLTWDVAGMRQWGEAMSRLGFPFGVPLVWTVISVQLLSSLALAARRLVVPACVGHIVVLCNGIWIVHAPRWFIVGFGANGMELPIMYIVCFASCILGYWPSSSVTADGGAVESATTGAGPTARTSAYASRRGRG